jgi:hypothetical protein
MFHADTCAQKVQEVTSLFDLYFHGVYQRDDLQDGFVVNDATVLGVFIHCLADPILGGHCGAIELMVGRDIYTDSEEDCASCKETACCFVFFFMSLEGVLHCPFTQE